MLRALCAPEVQTQWGRLVDIEEDLDGAGEQQAELPLDRGRLVLR